MVISIVNSICSFLIIHGVSVVYTSSSTGRSSTEHRIFKCVLIWGILLHLLDRRYCWSFLGLSLAYWGFWLFLGLRKITHRLLSLLLLFRRSFRFGMPFKVTNEFKLHFVFESFSSDSLLQSNFKSSSLFSHMLMLTLDFNLDSFHLRL